MSTGISVIFRPSSNISILDSSENAAAEVNTMNLGKSGRATAAAFDSAEVDGRQRANAEL